MPQPSRITQPLFARARICREVARASSDKEIAKSFEKLAAECIRTTR